MIYDIYTYILYVCLFVYIVRIKNAHLSLAQNETPRKFTDTPWNWTPNGHLARCFILSVRMKHRANLPTHRGIGPLMGIWRGVLFCVSE